MEYYQEQRINIIKEILPNIKNCILKGGTSLLLYYDLDRYSEDIDLDSISSNPNIFEMLKHIIQANNWNYRIAKDTPTVFRIMIDYNGQSPSGNYPLKIEVSSRNFKLLQKNLLNYTKIDNVLVYTVDELIKMKCNTFSQRDKIRDLYDIGFLLKKYPNRFSLDNLKLIYENINYKGMDILSAQLSGEIKQHLLTNIDSDEYLLTILDTCENLIELNIKNNGEPNFFKDISLFPNIEQTLDDELIR